MDNVRVEVTSDMWKLGHLTKKLQRMVLRDLTKEVLEAGESDLRRRILFIRTKKPLSPKISNNWKWFRQSAGHYQLRNPKIKQVVLEVLNDGNKRYTITAEKGKFLAFKDGGGNSVFRRSVTIPAKRGHKFLQATAAHMVKFMESYIERRLKEFS